MNAQLESLKKKQGQLSARIQRLESAEKHKELKKDLRRKILLGALVLEGLKADDPLAKALQAKLNGYLTRDTDRALFELSPLPRKETQKEPTETA